MLVLLILHLENVDSMFDLDGYQCGSVYSDSWNMCRRYQGLQMFYSRKALVLIGGFAQKGATKCNMILVVWSLRLK